MKITKICLSVSLLLLGYITSFAQLFQEKKQDQLALNQPNTEFVEKIKNEVTTKSTRFVSIGDVALFQAEGLLRIEVPGIEGTIIVDPTHVDYDDPENYIWSGNIVGTDQIGYVSIVAREGLKGGFIQRGSEFFNIIPVNREVSIVRELTISKSNGDDCGNTEQYSDAALVQDFCANGGQCANDISILVLIPQDLRAFFGGQAATAQIQTLIQVISGVETINLAFINSGINHHVRWTSQNINFPYLSTTDPDSEADINRLSTDATAAALRNTAQADVVMMITTLNYAGIAGISGGAASVVNPNILAAFAITELPSMLSPRWTFAHEFAHLLGAHHNRADNCSTAMVCGDRLVTETNCSHGLVFNGSTAERRTIMARMFSDVEPTAVRLLNYSNPAIVVDGVATGTAIANNANIIRNSFCFVSNYFDGNDFNVYLENQEWCDDENLSMSVNIIQPSTTTGFSNLGLPPYTMEWRWAQNPITNNSVNLGTLIPGATSATLNLTTPLAVPSFWVQITVRSSDNQIRRSSAKVTFKKNCDGPKELVQGNNPNNQVFIYPNPASDQIQISASSVQRKLSILITDILGQYVETYELENQQSLNLNTEKYSAGVYNITIKEEGFSETQQFIINKL